MEMHHLEMFQRIMALEAENKQLRSHLESMRRSFHEASNRIEGMVDGGGNGSNHPQPYPRYIAVPNNGNGNYPKNAGLTYPSPPPPPTMVGGQASVYETVANAYDAAMEHHRIAFPPVVDPPPQDRDAINLTDPFHLD